MCLLVVFTLLFLVGLFLLVGCLAGYHAMLMSLNLTTWEQLAWRRISYLKVWMNTVLVSINCTASLYLSACGSVSLSVPRCPTASLCLFFGLSLPLSLCMFIPLSLFSLSLSPLSVSSLSVCLSLAVCLRLLPSACISLSQSVSIRLLSLSLSPLSVSLSLPA